MLRSLTLENVGPAAHLELDPIAPRLNLITGDNGLGKSFLLDTAWWALTRTWAGEVAVPTAQSAVIGFQFDTKSTLRPVRCPWHRPSQSWKRPKGRPPNPGLVVYARVDGSFSVWDPERNYRLYTRADGSQAESPPAYHFSRDQVMWGLEREVVERGTARTQRVCAGLVADWVSWQKQQLPQFKTLTRLLAALGPDNVVLTCGDPVRPSLDDIREIPTIRMPYHQDVPLTYAPAGVRRVACLAYLLTWAFSEHAAECLRLGHELALQVIVLWDEPETHLHPRWQRTVLRGLTDAIEATYERTGVAIQYLVATHSPLVLASVEPTFDETKDALWKLDADETTGVVTVKKDVWRKRGDVSRWLRSDVFDLEQATSKPAEDVMREAGAMVARTNPDPLQVLSLDRRILKLFSEQDPFFLSWRHYMDRYLPQEEE